MHFCSQGIGPEAPVGLLAPQTHSFFPSTCMYSRRIFDKSSRDQAFQTITVSRRGILFLQGDPEQEVSFYQSQCLRAWRWGEKDVDSLGVEHTASNPARSAGSAAGLRSECLRKRGDGQVYISGYSNHLTLRQITAILNFDQILWKNASLMFGGDGQVVDSDERSFRQGEGWQGVRIQVPMDGCERARGFALRGRKHKKRCVLGQQGWVQGKEQTRGSPHDISPSPFLGIFNQTWICAQGLPLLIC